jgi:DNA-binding transcriptional regulator YiaG
MTEVLDRDSVVPDFGEDRLPSATVAFHTFEGMVAAGQAVRVGTTEGTRSLYVSHHTPTWSRLNVVEFLGAALGAADDSAIVEQTLDEHIRVSWGAARLAGVSDELSIASSEALGLVQAVEHQDLRAVLMTVLALRLTEAEEGTALSRVRGLADSVEHPGVRAALRAVLAPSLPAEELPRSVSDAVAGADAADGESDAEAMARMAWESIRRHGPAVEVQAPEVPEMTDKPVENIRRLFNLTYGEFARLFGITERHAHRWAGGRAPAERQRAVDALEAVGMTLVGGLGPEGAKVWLRSGEPSPEELLMSGRLDELVAAADKHRDSPFT